MAMILFGEDEAAQLLRTLVESGALPVAARARDGKPLFDPADIRCAAEEFALAAREARRRKAKGPMQ